MLPQGKSHKPLHRFPQFLATALPFFIEGCASYASYCHRPSFIRGARERGLLNKQVRLPPFRFCPCIPFSVGFAFLERTGEVAEPFLRSSGGTRCKEPECKCKGAIDRYPKAKENKIRAESYSFLKHARYVILGDSYRSADERRKRGGPHV
jgi:hypothetical protein